MSCIIVTSEQGPAQPRTPPIIPVAAKSEAWTNVPDLAYFQSFTLPRTHSHLSCACGGRITGLGAEQHYRSVTGSLAGQAACRQGLHAAARCVCASSCVKAVQMREDVKGTRTQRRISYYHPEHMDEFTR